MSYVDGFVVPVPKKNLAAYKKMAKKFSAVAKENGALEYIECIGDDVPPGKVTSFAMSVKLKSNEVVAFSWMVFKNKAARDKAWKRMMKDPRLEKMHEGVFDGKRMIFGGFKPLFEM